MSSDLVIRVSNLGKKYRIRHQTPERYTALRDVIARAAGAPFRRLGASVKSYLLSENGYRPPNNHSPLTDNQSSNGVSPASASASQALRTSTSDFRSSSEDFWALRHVSFEVRRGEVLGIIGRNGAGKSTLLKILSRITEPTIGTIEIEGRVASLLEVGTGFHPELTGRENIFLNGAILGMTRAEIRKKFDEIVDFSEIEQFLDTPVKRFSSGMYVRLAFAVAAFLEPDILVVDEVLSVGDAEFQKKSLGKMEDAANREGRTVLFVSHSMASIEKLCTKALLFTRGNLSHSGKVRSVVEAYVGEPRYESEIIFQPQHDKPSITKLSVDLESLARGDLILHISFISPFPLNPPIPGFVVSSTMGVAIFGSNPRFHKEAFNRRSCFSGTVRAVARRLPIVAGDYHLSVWLGDWHTDYDEKLNILAMQFRPASTAEMRPATADIGHLDWSTDWTIL